MPVLVFVNEPIKMFDGRTALITYRMNDTLSDNWTDQPRHNVLWTPSGDLCPFGRGEALAQGEE
jgi:hypothetical protein